MSYEYYLIVAGRYGRASRDPVPGCLNSHAAAKRDLTGSPQTLKSKVKVRHRRLISWALLCFRSPPPLIDNSFLDSDIRTCVVGRRGLRRWARATNQTRALARGFHDASLPASGNRTLLRNDRLDGSRGYGLTNSPTRASESSSSALAQCGHGRRGPARSLLTDQPERTRRERAANYPRAEIVIWKGLAARPPTLPCGGGL